MTSPLAEFTGFDSPVPAESGRDGDATLLPVSQSVVFDIETSPAWISDSIDDAKAYCEPLGIEYDPDEFAGEHPGEFDPAAIKTGNMKDQNKIDAKIEAARAAHEKSISSWQQSRESGHDEFWRQQIDQAPLSPITGKVLAIGYLSNGQIQIDNGDESELLRRFWIEFETARDSSAKMTGWNILGFDVPFIVWRSAHLRIEIPRGVYRGKWPSDVFIDCMDRWARMLNPWKSASGGLSAKHAAAFLGCKRPGDEIEGKHFWRYFQGDESQRALADRYLRNDVTEEAIIAQALGVI